MTREELQTAGFELSEAEHAQLARLVELVLDETTRVNLTATREPRAFWGLHVCDSLALLALLDAHPVARLIDIGTGGGLPGLVIACVCPDVEVTLLDSTQKKVAAIERMAAALELRNVRTAWGRAETLAHEPAYRERFDAAAVRAVGPLRVVIELASGFCRPGGQAWFFRSVQSASEELAEAERAAGRCRLSHVETRGYALPEPHGERAFVVYHKDRELPKSLPREPGKPKAKPL